MFFSLFLVAAVVLLVAWALGAFAFHVAGGLIHVLLVVAVISLIAHFARGDPSMANPTSPTTAASLKDMEGAAQGVRVKLQVRHSPRAQHQSDSTE